MKRPPRWPAWVALVLSAAGIVLAIVLLQEHLDAFEGDTIQGPFCGGGGSFDCARVTAHPASWMFGLPTASWGLMMYIVLAGLSLLAVAMRGAERAAAVALGALLTTAALIVDGYLGYVMVVQVGSICIGCATSYLVNLALAAMFWTLLVRSPDGRSWRGLFLRWTPAPAAPAPVAGDLAPAPEAMAAIPSVERPSSVLAKAVIAVLVVGGLATAAVKTQVSVQFIREVNELEADEFLGHMKDSTAVDASLFAGQPSRGPADAPLTIAMAGDFECSWCRGLANNVERLRTEFPDRIRIVFVNSPLDSACNSQIKETIHDDACWLAKTAECADAQGHFWEYHDLLFSRLPLTRVKPKVVEAHLREIGLDPERVRACRESGEAEVALAKDVALLRLLKIDAVPAIYFNGYMKSGGISPMALRRIVLHFLAEPPRAR